MLPGIKIQQAITNPPSFNTIAYTLGVFLLLYLLGSNFEINKNCVTKAICQCGIKSFDIFLYHMFFVKIVSLAIRFLHLRLSFVTTIVYFFAAMLGPVILVNLFSTVRQKVIITRTLNT